MYMDKNLKNDPFNSDAVLGWIVICCHPWHLAGLYEKEDDARLLSARLGASYEIFFGSYARDGNVFKVWGVSE
ncbi:hypothetical protein DKG82_22860 [Salmonella enterica subsp. enterica serovar Lexington]|uniref:Uncharacterized protein n=2 Tax=Salmonella enterica TaxID=28901 RepID=A0A379YM25_SALER|nr:hypothetical protein [Salmonella enterica]EAA0562682.1 hypothetical protein [Salmonella enterica subsp. enterica serovar Lexington]EAA7937195.1 hypothetical protein [Salmonella enterica subsp. enterica serovar Teko]ECF5887263.1 hypothetical protein [Salmonella enterica subsp. indica]EDV9142553.1 hypothetical protein [Salmonella enterica subsp. enterica serovar Gombe]EDV9731973.1 hypothetical protein [Salmonella enterica subsp. enterica]EDW8089662.1 hypothetical protein [Salmonella enterica